jgi:hypothetical protein
MPYALPMTTLGHTGLVVTRLGIGGAYCKTPEGYRAALDCGVNYVDTARAYRDGEDEKVIGEAIAGMRDRLVLASKTMSRDTAGARRDLETSLTLLRTDHLDIWHIHYINNAEDREKILAPGGALEAALKAREEGLVRFIGVTGHNWEQVGLAAATGFFDNVLCWYNCGMKEPEELIFPHAIKYNMGVAIMHSAANDKLFDQEGAPERPAFYRYVLAHPAVHVALLGLRDVAFFQRLAQALSERVALLPGERKELEAYGRKMRALGKCD